MRIDVNIQLPPTFTRVYVSLTDQPGKSTVMLPDGKWFMVSDQSKVTHWQAFPEVKDELRTLSVAQAC